MALIYSVKRIMEEKWKIISFQLVHLVGFYLSNLFYIFESKTHQTIQTFKKCSMKIEENILASVCIGLANIFNYVLYYKNINSKIKKLFVYLIECLKQESLIDSFFTSSIARKHFRSNSFTFNCSLYLLSYFKRVQSNILFHSSSYETFALFSFKVRSFMNRKYSLFLFSRFYKQYIGQLFKYSTVFESKQTVALFSLLFVLVFKSHIVNCQTGSFFLHATSRNIDIDDLIDYDEGLFNELNMVDVLQSVYLSCYKEKLDDLKSKYSTSHSSNFVHQLDFNRLSKYILFELINSEYEILPSKAFKFIQSVCTPNNGYDLFDKLYNLSEFEHEVCGNIFRNSIKYSHLLNYVLDYKQTRNEEESKSFNLKKKKSYNSKVVNTRSEKSYFNETREVFDIDLEHFVSKSSDYSSLNSKSYLKEIEEDDYVSSTPVYELNQSYDKSVLSLAVSVVPKVAVNQKVPTVRPSAKNTHQIYVNNCTLSLLKIYLLAVKSKCDYDEFQENLNQFDCYSDTFSVRSNCTLCAEAYRKWACSSNIPYYLKDKLAKPCMRYCFKVQNLCPFFRPGLTDSYGGQPVFHCRNVVQASEARIDGFEDDDENYYDDDKNDEDHCYEECDEPTTSPHLNRTELAMDLDILFRKETNILRSLIKNASLDEKIAIKSLSIKKAWLARKSRNLTRLVEAENSIYSFGRFKEANECLFNTMSSAVSNRISRLEWLNLIFNGYMMICFLLRFA